MAALSQYTEPRIPPENQWIDRPAASKDKGSEESVPSEKTRVAEPNSEVKAKARPARRPPSRRLVRHVLRSRVEATNALAAFFDHLTQGGSDKRVRSSPHLAKMYGGEAIKPSGSGADNTLREDGEGWRNASEVVTFLRKRGAKIPSLGGGLLKDEWALSSEGEGYGTGEEAEEPIWVGSRGGKDFD